MDHAFEHRIKSLLDNVVSSVVRLPKSNRFGETVCNSCGDSLVFNKSGRKFSPDGFYFVTVVYPTGSACHRVIILKKGDLFSVFNPNGKFSGRNHPCDFFSLSVYYDGKKVPLNENISPEKDWNGASGQCDVWGVLLPILYGGKTCPSDKFKPFTSSQISHFYSIMNSMDGETTVGELWVNFIVDKYFLNPRRSYKTDVGIFWFVRQIRGEIEYIITEWKAVF